MNLSANASRAMPEERLLEVQARNGPKDVRIAIEVSSVGRWAKTQSGSTCRSPRPSAKPRRSAWVGISKSFACTRSIWSATPAPSRFELSLPSMSRSDPTAAKSEALAESSACVLIVDDEGPCGVRPCKSWCARAITSWKRATARRRCGFLGE